MTRFLSLLVLPLCVGVAACAGPHAVAGAGDRETRQLLTQEELRSTILGKIVTFPEGQAVTGYECHVFAADLSALVCRNGDTSRYGQVDFQEDRVCAGDSGSICWQFFRSEGGAYFVRHLAFEPRFVEEPVCIADWDGNVTDCG